ncbi:MAG: hypothetical protein WC761_02185 [Candidatus Paceibacterota bacterium]
MEEVNFSLKEQTAQQAPPVVQEPDAAEPVVDATTMPADAPPVDSAALPPVDASGGIAPGGDPSLAPPDAGGLEGGAGGMPGEEGLDGESEEGDLGGDAGGGFGALGGGGGGGFGGGGDDGGMDGDEEPPNNSPTPEGEPEKNQEDPVGAAFDEATKIAELTTDIQKIVNAVKASIQVNFSDYKEAWPLIEKLRETGDTTLDAVADRLSLFIAGVLEENKTSRKRNTVKLKKEDLKEMINQVVKEQQALGQQQRHQGNPPPAAGSVSVAEEGKVTVTKENLQKMVREAVRRKLTETTGYVEQERMRQDMNMLALEFLEKLTQKLNIDAGSLTPEALESYKRIHKQLEMAVRQAAADMFQLGAVVASAQDGSGGGNKPSMGGGGV